MCVYAYSHKGEVSVGLSASNEAITKLPVGPLRAGVYSSRVIFMSKANMDVNAGIVQMREQEPAVQAAVRHL